MSFYEIYFSPTGGTKKVADALGENILAEKIKIDLIKNAQDLEKLSLTGEDICLVAVPSYGGRVSVTAAEQLKTVKGNGARAILTAVYGNRHIDDTLMELYDILKENGFACVAGVEAVAEHSLMHRFGAGRPDAQDREELAEFAARIKALLEKGTRTEPTFPGRRPYKVFGGVSMKPEVTGECNRCGICAAECPAHAIPKENPNFTDKEACMTCMHCVFVCPKQARQLDKLMLAESEKRLEQALSGRKENKLYL